eukprot:TRINITY_DN16423_c0_g1_i1.p1 TRINITY_DN16423_c0_g1~~TRINITY_DN16423_c0_g1_i1.p1  ORF type:complete len:229 (-),score=61.83 TRINITY_DN16423_c0_g1_i1:129-815(-)
MKRRPPRSTQSRSSAASDVYKRQITEGFCCPSEVDSIINLLSPVEGVASVSINSTTKIALVKHNASVITAEQILEVLNKSARFKGTLSKDKLMKTKITVKGMCCSSEIPQLESILKTLPGVATVLINAITNEATIEHDPKLTSPDALVLALNQGAFKGSALKSSEAAEGADTKKWPKWNVLLSGLFLAVAFVHYAKNEVADLDYLKYCLLYTSPSPRDRTRSRMPSSA